LPEEVSALATSLTARHQPFVLATVVWRRAPTSATLGAKAIVTADGRLRGWVGGACSEEVVIREALRALEEGRPRLLSLAPSQDPVDPRHEEVVRETMGCASEGAVEIFLDPHLPRRHLVVIGAAPVARVLATMGAALGFDVVMVDAEGAHDELPGEASLVPELDLTKAGVVARSFVVVATMGHYDEEALGAALGTEAGYVALVASAKRAAAVLESLRAGGISDEDVGRVRSPAGLDLGHIRHEEIAVAVLAQIVQIDSSSPKARARAAELAD
jgi:xanthine dehydrogenase accessory factor